MIPALALALALLAEPAPATRCASLPTPSPSLACRGRHQRGLPVPQVRHSGRWWPAPWPASPPASWPWPRRLGGPPGGGTGGGGGRGTPWWCSSPGTAAAPPRASSPIWSTLMGIHPGEARYFDYRWADGGADHTQASQEATVDDLADALGGYAGRAGRPGPAHLPGGVQQGRGRDRRTGGPVGRRPARRGAGAGAALLDPPMASGVLRLPGERGHRVGPSSPTTAATSPSAVASGDCTDSRDHLGAASGVQVMVVRNPKSGVARFSDIPEGLRVYEAADDGPGLFETLFTRPWTIASRISAAHNSLLHDPRVADCIVAEMGQTGACPLPQAGRGTGIPSWLERIPRGHPTGGAVGRSGRAPTRGCRRSFEPGGGEAPAGKPRRLGSGRLLQ